MKPSDYLESILDSQTLDTEGDEIKALQKHREEVDNLLRNEFEDCSPTIRYGGSKAKGTMIRELYDLDIICYFAHDDTGAGETLEDIYNNVEEALKEDYSTQQKTSAIRLQSKKDKIDFHIDVVPGRFTDKSKSDAFLHQTTGKKERLKTNLDTHISHVKKSGVIDAIRLMKLWKVRNSVGVKNFVLELLVIDILDGYASKPLDEQLKKMWETLRDEADSLSVEDPANPAGNDLMPLLDSCRDELKTVASSTLRTLKDKGWEAIFGDPNESKADKAALYVAAKNVTVQTRPYGEEKA